MKLCKRYLRLKRSRGIDLIKMHRLPNGKWIYAPRKALLLACIMAFGGGGYVKRKALIKWNNKLKMDKRYGKEIYPH